jgi:peptidyl-tRNA hydrolase
MPPHTYVLKRLGKQELEEFEVTCAHAALVARTVLEEGLLRAMNEYNRSVKDAGEEGGHGREADTLPT